MMIHMHPAELAKNGTNNNHKTTRIDVAMDQVYGTNMNCKLYSSHKRTSKKSA